VVRAFATLRRELPAVLVLVGDGPELSKAEALARELGVREHLRLMGQQERIEEVLKASDLFLLPSRAESFGLAALEAMACGCPVLGYHAGGLPEVVEDGISGILCPEGSDVCLGTLAARLLQDEPRYQAMRRAARARAEQFAAATVIDHYAASLQALADRPANEPTGRIARQMARPRKSGDGRGSVARTPASAGEAPASNHAQTGETDQGTVGSGRAGS